MTLRKGDVCLVNLSGGFGHEQFGSRPAVVLAATDTSIVVVAPITANTDALRFSHTIPLSPRKDNGLVRKSVALIFHLRAVDRRRIEQVLGRLSDDVLSKIDKGVRRLLNV